VQSCTRSETAPAASADRRVPE